MTAALAAIRQALYDAIASHRDHPPDTQEEGYDPDVDGEPYVIPSFTLLQTYLPRVLLTELAESTRVSLIGLAGDEERLTRGAAWQLDQPIQVAVQAKIDPQDQETLDDLVSFVEQLRHTARRLTPTGAAWLRTTALKDPARTPYDYVRLREAHTFEAVFTVFYRLSRL